MDGNSHVLSGANLEVDRIRYGLAFSRHGHTGLTIEGQTDGRGLINLCAAASRLSQCQLHALDLRGTRAELVGQFQAHLLSTDGHLHNLAQRIITQSWRRGIVMLLYQLWGCTPCAYPMIVGTSNACDEHAGPNQYCFFHFNHTFNPNLLQNYAFPIISTNI